MNYDVLVEKVENNGYVARVMAWSDCVVQADTRDEALAQVRQAIEARLTQADIVTIEVSSTKENLLLRFAGIWADNPDFDGFQKEIENYRRELDAENDDSSGVNSE